MENKFLPAVRVPTLPAREGDEGDSVSETPIVDLPPSEKFAFAFPDKAGSTHVLPGPGNAQSPPADTELSEPESSEAESQTSRGTPITGGKDSADNTPTAGTPNSNLSPSPPRLSRAFSMPLPSQLGNLNHPHRTPVLNTGRVAYFDPPSPIALAEPPSAYLQEFSVELADSVQMVIQTLLQISPPHLLDPAKEQFSGCSLSVPSPSISAMLTAMKNLNYMSANMSTFADDSKDELSFRPDIPLKSPVKDDFDVGETLQSVGDALSGIAAQAGVELVLYHADVGMKHVSVKGDECGVSYALSHVVRQILDTTRPGDTLEIGLSITLEADGSRESGQSVHSSDGGSRSSSRASSFPDSDGLLRCTFEVGHKFASSDATRAMKNNPHVTVGTELFRAKPRLDTVLCRRLLRQIGGTLKEDLQPRLFSPGRSCELSVVLEKGSTELLSRPPRLSPEEQALRQPYASMNIQLASEPSLEELLQFVDSLRGKKAALHASPNGSFAHHLTSYLTAWGLDVSHMSLVASEEDLLDTDSTDTTGGVDESHRRLSPSMAMTDSPFPVEVNPIEEQLREKSEISNTTFIIIDDDVEALRNRLVQLRSEASFNLNMRRRPKLAAHHRPKSSPQIYRAKGLKQSTLPQQTNAHPVVIHFTSLQNYKLVKDLIYTIFSTPNSSVSIPEVIVLPKPAGPRRVLTALRTAVEKPIVDPFFSPIATSPVSPNGQGPNPFSSFIHGASPSQKPNRPSISPRTASDRSMRSSKDGIEIVQRLPPSPLRESDSLEYFSEAAEKLGASPSSGLVIQSPDGQPAGIFFHPRGAGTRQQTDVGNGGSVVSPPSLVRDSGNLRPLGEHRRTSLQRRITTQTHDGDMSPGERPKLSSRPKGPPRIHSGMTYFNNVEDVAPSEAATPAHCPSQRRKSDSPRDELPPPPELINTGPTPPINAASDNLEFPPRISTGVATDRKLTSPPLSPATARGKRGFARRGTAESPQSSGTPSGKKSKLSADGNIVPPVNVLIVEDNPINQTILSTFMRKKKIKYDVAKDGAEAVAKWKTGSFHLILMDIQMPVMDGIQATKEIRLLERQAAANAFASTPPLDGEQTPSDAPSTESKSSMGSYTPYRSSVIIVALTASSLQTDRVAALAAGCNDFLTKPVSLLWLNNKIIEWGSIKALQMWADLRPEVMKNVTSGQASQAKAVASKLHVPENRRNRSPPTAPTTTTTRTQIEAMRKLSSAARIPLSRGLDIAESDHSDMENRAAALSTADTKAPNTPAAGTDAGSSGSSAAADTHPEYKSKANLSTSIMPRVVSGEEALQAHLEDSQDIASSVAEQEALGHSIVLGGRTIGDPPASIAELMHADNKQELLHTDSSSRIAESSDCDLDSKAQQESCTASLETQAEDEMVSSREPPQQNDS